MTHHCLQVSQTPHPDGAPFAYCQACSFVVVRFVGQWWHLTKSSPDLKPRKCDFTDCPNPAAPPSGWCAAHIQASGNLGKSP